MSPTASLLCWHLPDPNSCPRCLEQAKRQAQLEHLVAAKRLEDRVAGILARVERELDDAGGWGGGVLLGWGRGLRWL